MGGTSVQYIGVRTIEHETARFDVDWNVNIVGSR